MTIWVWVFRLWYILFTTRWCASVQWVGRLANHLVLAPREISGEKSNVLATNFLVMIQPTKILQTWCQMMLLVTQISLQGALACCGLAGDWCEPPGVSWLVREISRTTGRETQTPTTSIAPTTRSFGKFSSSPCHSRIRPLALAAGCSQLDWI